MYLFVEWSNLQQKKKKTMTKVVINEKTGSITIILSKQVSHDKKVHKKVIIKMTGQKPKTVQVY